MFNTKAYEEDFKKLGLNEAEQQVVLDYFHQLGNIIFNNYKKTNYNDKKN